MATLGRLIAELGIDSAKFKQGLDNARKDLNSFNARMTKFQRDMERQFKAFSRSVFSAQGALVALASSAVIGGLWTMVKAFGEADKAVVKLNSALKATGRFSQSAVDAIQKNAAAISKLTTFDDDDIVSATATFAQFARQLSGSELAQAQQGIVGLAQVMGTDLETAAKQLGKAVAGTSDTIGRSGIKMSEAKDQSERLSESLEKLNSMYLQAQGEAESLEGRSAQLNVAWGNLQETMGGLISKILGGTDALASFRDMIIRVDEFLQQHEKTIISTTQFLLQMGETAMQMGSVVVNGIGTAVNAVGFAIAGTVENALKFIQLLTNNAVHSINSVITLANMIPGVKMGKVGSVNMPGLNFASSLRGQFGADFFNTAGKVGQGLGDLASGKTNVHLGTANRLGHASIAGAFGGDMGGGGGGGKKAHHKKTDAEKAMERMKHEADALKDRVKSAWDKYKEGIKNADKLLKAHLITMEDHRREIVRLEETVSLKLLDAPKTDAPKEGKVFTGMEDYIDRLKEEGKQLTEQMRSPLQQLIDDVSLYNDMLAVGAIEQETWNAAVTNAWPALEGMTERADGLATAIGNVTAEFGEKFFDTFIEGLKNGELAFKEFAMSAMEDLSKLIFKMTVTVPIANALTNALSGGLGGFFGNLFGGGAGSIAGKAAGLLLSGARADGGPVDAGRSYLVGERGPEVFTPSSRGNIIPNHALGGSPPIIVNQTINLSTGVAETVRQEVSKMRPQLRRDAIDAVSTAINRGGTMARQVGARG